jgi:hypothetical protein
MRLKAPARLNRGCRGADLRQAGRLCAMATASWGKFPAVSSSVREGGGGMQFMRTSHEIYVGARSPTPWEAGTVTGREIITHSPAQPEKIWGKLYLYARNLGTWAYVCLYALPPLPLYTILPVPGTPPTHTRPSLSPQAPP